MLDDAIDTFFDHYTKSTDQLTTHFDPDWPSACERGSHWVTADDERLIRWAPVRRVASHDFAGLENALEYEIHRDIKTHYGRYWSANLPADAPDGRLSLLFLWNDQDVERLIENLIGHAVACRHNKTPFAVFFACTEDPEDYYLTVNNSTGAVQLEQPGYKPLRVVADNLEAFYASLVPATDQD